MNELLEQWEASNRNDFIVRWAIVPSNPDSSSIFTLPVEFPRYRSLLLGMPTEDIEALDSAWESYYQGKYAKASNLFGGLARSNSPNLDAVNGLAWSLMHAKQINKSEKTFKEILELYPYFLGAFKGLREIEEIKKRQAVYVQNYYEYAIDKFLKSIEHEDYEISSAKGLGLSLFAIKNYSDAIPYLQMALKSDPENKDMAYKLDWSILRSESLGVSQKYFEDVLKNHPLRASPYMALGWIHYNWRNPDLGVEYFLKAISLDPDFALTPEFLKLLKKERFEWQVIIPWAGPTFKINWMTRPCKCSGIL